MTISSHIFKDYVSSLKTSLDELFKYDSLGSTERGWIKYSNTIKVFSTKSQSEADLLSEIFNSPKKQVSDKKELIEEWGYGVLYNDSVCNIFLTNVLVMKSLTTPDYRIYSINVGVTSQSAIEQGQFFTKAQFPTLNKVIKDFKNKSYKSYQSLISDDNTLTRFNDWSDRLSDFNWISNIIKMYLKSRTDWHNALETKPIAEEAYGLSKTVLIKTNFSKEPLTAYFDHLIGVWSTSSHNLKSDKVIEWRYI